MELFSFFSFLENLVGRPVLDGGQLSVNRSVHRPSVVHPPSLLFSISSSDLLWFHFYGTTVNGGWMNHRRVHQQL